MGNTTSYVTATTTSTSSSSSSGTTSIGYITPVKFEHAPIGYPKGNIKINYNYGEDYVNIKKLKGEAKKHLTIGDLFDLINEKIDKV